MGIKLPILYHYWAYGLTVASELEFPELFPLSGHTLCTINLSLGVVPVIHRVEGGIHSESLDITSREYRLRVQGVAEYYVCNGDNIILSPEPNANIDLVRLFCLSNAFAALLYQRRIIPLHCAALIHQQKLVMIMGNSGMGKSTTMAALMQKGFSPFSDDVCVPVRADDGNWSFYSSYPMMKFWKSTLDQVGEGLILDRKVRPDIEKYGVYFHDRFITDPLKPKAIFLLSDSEINSSPELTEVSGVQLFQLLDMQAYRGEYLSALGLQKEHFHFFTELSNQVRCFIIKRNSTANRYVDLTELICSELSKLQHV